MRVTFDAEADIAYIYLVGTIARGEAQRQVIAGQETIALLDLDREGKLLGVKVFDASRRLRPESLAQAERIN